MAKKARKTFKRRKTKIKAKKKRRSSYENYVDRYKKAEESMRRRGREMFSPMMSKEEYENARQFMIDTGVTTNINQTIISEQQYQYSRKTARRWLDTAKELGLDWDDSLIFEIRTGKIDLSGLNEELKRIHPDWTGSDRAEYISNEVFGSE